MVRSRLPDPAARSRIGHGPIGRIALVLVGLLVAVSFGSPAVFVRHELVAGHLRAVTAGGVLAIAVSTAIAVYGWWLCWRGLRGYSRPAPRFERFMLLLFVPLFAAAAAGFVFAFVQVIRAGPLTAYRAAWFSDSAWQCVTMTLALPLQLAAHELGHILAGRRVGFTFVALQVGPFRVDRPLTVWRVTWQPLAFGFGGRATMLETRGDRLPLRRAVFAAGGPAANFVFAICAALTVMAYPPPATGAAALAIGVLRACVWQGALLGVVNLVPVRGGETDGSRIVAALRARSARAALGAS